MKISIVVPVYNEEKAVGQVIDELVAVMRKTRFNWEILVVDDGSTDRSLGILKNKGIENKKIIIVEHEKNRGVGAARTTGILKAKGEIIVMIDADCTYPAEMIPKMLESFPGCDMVIGARKVEAGTYQFLRTLAKNFVKKLAEIVVSEKIPDLNSGLRAFKKEKAVRFIPIFPTTHSWVSTITLAFLSTGLRVKYIPIDYMKRKGRSSFHPFRDTYNYLSLVVRTVMYFNPIRIFLPLSLFLLFGGLVKSVFDLVYFKNMQESDITIISGALIVGAIGLLADLIVVQGKLRENK